MTNCLSTVGYHLILCHMNETLASFVISRREELGLKQGELADLVGTSRAYMSQIEGGKPKWPQTIIPELASALRVSQQRLAIAAGLIEENAGAQSSQATLPFSDTDIRGQIVWALTEHDVQSNVLIGIKALIESFPKKTTDTP